MASLINFQSHFTSCFDCKQTWNLSEILTHPVSLQVRPLLAEVCSSHTLIFWFHLYVLWCVDQTVLPSNAFFNRPPGFRCAHVGTAGARCFSFCCVILVTLVSLYCFRVVFEREDWAFSCSSSCTGKWIHTPSRQTQTFQNHQLQMTNGGVYCCFTVIYRHSFLHFTFSSNLKHGSMPALKRVMTPCVNWYTLSYFTEMSLCSEEPEKGHRVVDQIKLLQISRVLPFIWSQMRRCWCES